MQRICEYWYENIESKAQNFERRSNSKVKARTLAKYELLM
jgi:hypothetical protein